MAIPNLGQVIAQAWEDAQEHSRLTMPDPFRSFTWFNDTQSYRERLDERVVNYYGNVVPRIEVVKNNLQFDLREPHLPASRLPQ